MKKVVTLLVFSLFGLVSWAQRGTVSGKITDAATGEPLIGANVIIDGTSSGTLSDVNGNYSVSLNAGSQILIISYVGYATLTRTVSVSAGGNTEVNFALETINILGQEVVVSASRKAEKLTNAPATISVIGAKAISELPSFNVAELLGRQRGLDYVRSGVLGIGVNARGFNSAFNPKNLQINDNRFSSLIATGLPLGALSTTVKEDIERIEVILGPSSALYGPNAHNGLINTITKDPRTSQGTTIALGAGNQSVFTGRLRHATRLSDKFSFKISGEYTQGEEFEYTDTVYLVANPGDIQVAAYEEYLLDRKFNSLRGEAALYFSPNDKSDLILTYGTSNSNNIGNTNAGRNQIRDWRVNILQLRYVSPRFFAQVYQTWSSTDSTYAMNRRTLNYHSFKNAGFSEDEARRRSLGEFWVPNPALPGGGFALNRGALFQDDSRRLNGEVQYNNEIAGFNYVVGAQFQRDLANSNGTYLLDKGEDIQIDQIGGYLQLERRFGEHFKAVVAARADNHDLYGFNFIPKAALLYITDAGTFRATYGKGIAAPTILNLEANIFGGLLLGNSQGFTLSDGSKVDALRVETIQTIEVGYKGSFGKKLFIDANAYYNISQDFLSPAINIATNGRTVTQRGSESMSAVVPGTPAIGAPIVLTYVNFGNVNTYGFDASLNYAFSNKLIGTLNYSWFGFDLDENDLANDGNRNGKVDENDLPINTPANKLGIGLNYSDKKFFVNLFGRWVQAYDFFSGINVSAAENLDLIYGGSPVRENRRVGTSFNYGPLGGFFNLDLGVGYRFNDTFTLSGQVVNVLNQEVREFVGSPAIQPLYSVELKVNLPAIGGKK
jgi:iron complex outermembrane receptor protein